MEENLTAREREQYEKDTKERLLDDLIDIGRKLNSSLKNNIYIRERERERERERAIWKGH